MGNGLSSREGQEFAFGSCEGLHLQWTPHQLKANAYPSGDSYQSGKINRSGKPGVSKVKGKQHTKQHFRARQHPRAHRHHVLLNEIGTDMFAEQIRQSVDCVST